jgi:hypothetical protein
MPIHDPARDPLRVIYGEPFTPYSAPIAGSPSARDIYGLWGGPALRAPQSKPCVPVSADTMLPPEDLGDAVRRREFIATPQHLQVLKDAAHARGLELSVFSASTPEAIIPAMNEASVWGAEAINVLATPLFFDLGRPGWSRLRGARADPQAF